MNVSVGIWNLPSEENWNSYLIELVLSSNSKCNCYFITGLQDQLVITSIIQDISLG